MVAETVVPPRVVNAAAPAAESPAPPAGIDEAVLRIAAEHSLSPRLIHSVIKVESYYNPHAISSTGAPVQAVESKEAGPAHVVEIVQADGSVRYVSR